MTKKYLKSFQLRDYLHVIASDRDRNAYEVCMGSVGSVVPSSAEAHAAARVVSMCSCGTSRSVTTPPTKRRSPSRSQHPCPSWRRALGRPAGPALAVCVLMLVARRTSNQTHSWASAPVKPIDASTLCSTMHCCWLPRGSVVRGFSGSTCWHQLQAPSSISVSSVRTVRARSIHRGISGCARWQMQWPPDGPHSGPRCQSLWLPLVLAVARAACA